MMAQPLETVPEETVAPAAPTTNTHITSDTPKTAPAKNPGRVASGKRLAERNRLAREAKKAAPSTTSDTTSVTTSEPSTSDTDSNSIFYIPGVGGLIVSVMGVYYQREAIMQRLGRKDPPPPANTPAPPLEQPPRQGIKKME